MSDAQAGNMHDVIIIGAGVTGVYALHRLLQMGLSVKVLDTAEGPGGTWYWNRYPGARFDSESYTYGYLFSKDIYDEWDWSEHFAGQPETLRYVNFVVDKLGLRDHMQFGSKVDEAIFDEEENCWNLTLADGRTECCRYLCGAVGALSAATLPRIEGRATFKGEAFHTYYWPKDREVDLEGKRVAVIGTGATGVQAISAIGPKAGSLTVFQRRPNWCAPLNNSKITDSEQTKIKASYQEIIHKISLTHGSFLHGADPRSYYDVPEEDRLAFWEELYASPGFGIWLSNFSEVLLEPEINAVFSEFIADKIRQRVKDPETAEKLIPRDHGFGNQRVPMETRYYEVYNQENVRLIDAKETPIECITPTGIRTSEEEFEFDIIVYATGFDAFTGSYDRIDIRGVGGQKLFDKWADGPVTYLGLQTSGFPNLFMFAGAQSASAAANFPPTIEASVNWAAELFEHVRDNDIKRVEVTPEAEAQWTNDIKASYEGAMLAKAKSWFTGYNSNVDGHDKLRHVMYLGGAPAYREKLKNVAESGYDGFEMA